MDMRTPTLKDSANVMQTINLQSHRMHRIESKPHRLDRTTQPDAPHLTNYNLKRQRNIKYQPELHLHNTQVEFR